ncbi:MAG: ABC transporter permease [Anaerolineales bacterium]|nr:ABC transporter permease [Anaerolineales bacterium]
MTSIGVIARLTFHEARRSRILLAAILLSVIFLLIYGLGFNFIQEEITTEARRGQGVGILEQSEIYNFLTMAGLYVVNFLAVMMTVLTSVGTLSGEIASGTIHSIAAKPLRRWQIVMGKWLGYVVMISLYVAFLGGGVLAIVFLLTDYSPPNPLIGISMIWLNAMVLLCLSLLGGSLLSTLTNGVLMFGLFGIAFVGGWIEQIGSFLENQTAISIGIITSLILPSEALWKRAAFSMQSPLVSALGGFSPFSANTVPSPLMVNYAVLFGVVALGLATLAFSRRDL